MTNDFEQPAAFFTGQTSASGKWSKLDLASILPKSLQQGAETVNEAISAINGVITFILDLVKILDALAVDIPDPLQLAIAGLINVLNSILKDLTKTVGVHVLSVPLIIPTDTAGKAVVTNLINQASQTDVAKALGVNADTFTIQGTTANNVRDAITQAERGRGFSSTTGGNVGFYSTVINSIYDLGDVNRPIYTDADYISAIIFMWGGTNLFTLFDALARLQGLFGVFGAGLDGDLIPIPQDLKARVIPQINITTNPGKVAGLGYLSKSLITDTPMAVQLKWNSDPALGLLSSLGLGNAEIKKVSLLRSTEPFDHRASQKKLQSLMIDERDYDVVTNTYVDRNILPDTVYWYAVSYRVQITDYSGNVSTLNNHVISNVVRINTKTPTQVIASVPPDWRAAQTPLSIIPELYNTIQSLALFLDNITNGVGSSTKILDQLIQMLEQLITRNAAIAQRIINLLASVVELLSLPELGIYTYRIAGKGGVQFFAGELASALSSSDTNAPPFKKGSELVGGLIILGGAPNLSSLDAMNKLLDLFSPAAGTTNPWKETLDILDSIGSRTATDSTNSPSVTLTAQQAIQKQQAFASNNDKISSC